MDRKDICDDEIVNQEIPRRFLFYLMCLTAAA